MSLVTDGAVKAAFGYILHCPALQLKSINKSEYIDYSRKLGLLEMILCFFEHPPFFPFRMKSFFNLQ